MRGIIVLGITALLVMQTGGDAAAQTVAGAERSEANAAEEPALQRPARLQVKGVSLNDALAQLSEHSGVVVAYSPTRLAAEAHVDCDCAELTVEEALRRLLAFTRYRYTEVDGHVVVVPRTVSKQVPPRDLFSSSQPFFASLSRMAPVARTPHRLAQQDTVSGIVVDAKTGEGLAGMQVTAVGTDRGALTDAQGRFRIDGLTGTEVTLRIQRVGYRTASQTVSVGAADVRFALEESAIALGELVVTAQKREERLQDVPVSVGVVTAEDIDRRGLVSEGDYLRGIPGVTQADMGFYGNSIVFRGLHASRQSANAYAGSTTATYFGETQTTSSAGHYGGTNLDIKLVDIERVEVLRGPQGTALGSSALGGAVRTIPVAPRLDRVEGRVAAGYSRTGGFGGDNYDAQGVVNLPLVKDRLGLRAVVYRFEESGYYRNRAGSDTAYQATAAEMGAQAFAIDEERVGDARFTGGRITALFQASDALQVTLTYLRQGTESDGYSMQNLGRYEQAVLQVAPEHRLRGQTGAIFDTDIDLANGMLTYDFGWADLLATYSYVNGGTTKTYPSGLTGTPGVAWSWDGSSYQRAHSGEVRVTTKLEGPWNFLGGIYVEDLDDDQPSMSFYWHGSPEAEFAIYGTTDPRWFWGSEEYKLHQKAAFAEASWEFLPRVTVTGGARVYDYERSSRTDWRGVFWPDGLVTTRRNDASGTSFRGNLSYKPSADALVYAGWAQGFRLGRPQVGLAPTCDADNDGLVDGTTITMESTRSTRSDYVNSHEVGSKVALLNGRLRIDANVYRADWLDVPISAAIPSPNPGCPPNFIANGGAARSEGFEVQTNLYITPAFRVDLGGSYVRARFTVDAPALDVSQGDRLPVPEVNAQLGLQYEFTLSGAPAFVRADPVYVSTFYGNVQEDPWTKAGGYVKVDTSARVALGEQSVHLFVRNLTNADDFTFRGAFRSPTGDYGFRLQPRTIGLRVSRSF